MSAFDTGGKGAGAKPASSFSKRNASKNGLETLYRRPGFLIRRAQQIAIAIFLEESGDLKITTTQYGILFVLKHKQGLDQISVAKSLGLDRSTTGMVLGKLENAGLIERTRGTEDKRRHNLVLTRAGERMLQRLAEPARRAQSRVLSAFSAEERKLFVDLLEKLVDKYNDTTRVPLVSSPSNGTPSGPAPAKT